MSLIVDGPIAQLAYAPSDDKQFWLIAGASLAFLVGLVGVIVPGLPGLTLCFAAVAGWGLLADGSSWVRGGAVLLCALWLVGGEVIKYLWAGKRMLASGVPKRSLLIGAIAGVVGLFVIPFVGLPIGFVAGIWGSEAQRLGGARQAWPGTAAALKAVGLAIAVEMGFGLLMLFTWIAALVAV
jgi:uncharacterized protein YqgC (DUF456 family)